jgi:hypothetical protein
MVPGSGTAVVRGDTTKVALALLPVPPLVELTGPVTFVYVPGAMPVMSRLTMQDVPPAAVPPERLIWDEKNTVTVPPHVLVKLLGVLTTRPGGNTSEKASPSKLADAFGSAMVNVRNVTNCPKNVTLAGLNASLMLGGRRGAAWTRPAGPINTQAARSAVLVRLQRMAGAVVDPDMADSK